MRCHYPFIGVITAVIDHSRNDREISVSILIEYGHMLMREFKGLVELFQ